VAVANFIPDLWAAKLLVALRKNTVATALVNRDYEGQVKRAGDSVKITSITRPTIGSYTAHSDITFEDIDDATRSLLIDQQKYFAFELDDVERAQALDAGHLMSQAISEAAYGLANTLDSWLLGVLEAGTSTSAPDNYMTEVTISTASAAYEALVDMSVLLDQSDVPEQNRFVVVTPAFHGKLLKDDRFVKAGDDPSAATRANGRVGEAAGLQVFKSNNLPTGDGAGAGTAMIAGYRGACTLAEQISSVEALRLEKRFADGVKGLHVYGAKVTRPEALVVADVIVS
jgi:hypothetical protein